MGEVVRPTTKDEDKHMRAKDKFVGLDVHKDTTVVAVADGGRDGEVRLHGTFSSDLHALEKLLGRLGGEDVRLHVHATDVGYGEQFRGRVHDVAGRGVRADQDSGQR